ncbi:MAG TPA: LLM class flavin-dependent oxidoreductase, partial [Dehalococcoidia bacterium]|nr:LLM class flavin-dependent oxidoreductase [Dehalococcoidia bacterium]
MVKPLGLILYPENDRTEWTRQVRAVQVADELGIDSVWVPEAWGRDAFPLITELALATHRIQIGTGIVNVYSRSPALMAMTAATIDEISGGRLILGLGTSGANVIEHWHGIPFDRPLRRLREYVEIVRLILRGDRLNYTGEIFRLERGFQLAFRPIRPAIPIVIASIAPRSIRQTGAIGDGIMPTFWPRERFGDLRAQLAAGAAEAGRPAEGIWIAPMIHLDIDDDAEAAKSRLRAMIAFYSGRMGVYYQQMFERNGYGAEVEAIQAAWNRRDKEGAAAAVG